MSTILPPALVRSLQKDYNLEEELFLNVHQTGEQVTSIRLNPFKSTSLFKNEELIPWCEQGRYLPQRPSFISDPLFHAGCYYVQEASSMFLEQIIKHTTNLNESLRILDLCASPGGKSTHLNSLINPESLLVSNELIKSRVLTLSDNLSKWGTMNTVVTNNDPADFKRTPGFFDVLVVDAPCSGSGMFRKDSEAIDEWSENAVTMCSQRQKRILSDVLPALKNNGILIYSTCSYSTEENEDIADWLCSEFGLESIRIPVDPAWNIEVTSSRKYNCPGYRFYPHKLKGEGFFITCLQKIGVSTPAQHFKMRDTRINRASLDILKPMLTTETEFRIIPAGDEYSVINPAHEDDISYLQSKLYLKKSGVRLARIAGKDAIPDHELAVSLISNPETSCLNLSYEQAIRYLRKEDIGSAITGIQGWTKMCYKDFALGWAKILPNRVNNYYPKGLRILKEI